LNRFKNHIIGGIFGAIILWTMLILSTGIPAMTIQKVGALIFGLVVTSTIFFLVILLIDKITITAIKQLIGEYRQGDSRSRIILIVSGILILMRIITDILR